MKKIWRIQCGEARDIRSPIQIWFNEKHKRVETKGETVLRLRKIAETALMDGKIDRIKITSPPLARTFRLLPQPKSNATVRIGRLSLSDGIF